MKENKMGVQPVNSLLISMAIPMMLSMLIQALYNIVDSMFVAQVSENALTAVSLAFPFQNLMIAVAVGTGVGVNSLLSRLLGEGKYDDVNKTAVNGLFLSLVSYAVFAIVGSLCAYSFFSMQTDVAEIIEGGHAYLLICSLFSFGCFLQCMLEKLLAATGKTVLTMLTQMTGALINIVLDPIFIFGWFGLPAMGIAGAAVATVTGQILSCFVGIYLNLRHNSDIHFQFKGFRPNGRIISAIYGVGVPSIIMSSIGSIMTLGLNTILISFSTTATAVFGVYFKLQSFVFMPIFGINNGMIPIVGYNFGAGQPARVMTAIKCGIFYATCIMLMGFAAFQLMPGTLLGLFNPSPAMLEIGIPALRIISIHFLLAGFCVICGAVFQALGHGMYSLWVSVIRQLLVLLPAAWLLAQSGNINMVWLAFPIAEGASFVVSSICIRKVYARQIHPMQMRRMPAAA